VLTEGLDLAAQDEVGAGAGQRVFVVVGCSHSSAMAVVAAPGGQGVQAHGQDTVAGVDVVAAREGLKDQGAITALNPCR
jgi:hypothetical protein